MLPNILGIDPGGTTGLCLWTPHNDNYMLDQVDTSLSDGSDLWIFHNYLKSTVFGINARLSSATTRYGDPVPSDKLLILLERFDFRHEERYRDKIDYKAREVIGVVKLFCWQQWYEDQANRRKIELVMQSASQAKGFWDMDKLRRVGLWKTSQRHAMDALRHVLYHRTFELGDKSLLEKLKIDS